MPSVVHNQNGSSSVTNSPDLTLQPPSGVPERPIQSASDDKLERGSFVQRLASALIDKATGKARGVVIGLTGPWGSGKSSTLNLLHEHLKDRYPAALVVSFDPWLVSGRNNLISEFIQELLGTIKAEPKIAKKLEGLASTIKKYGDQLAPTVGIVHPIFGLLAKAGVGALRAADSKKESLAVLRQRLVKELAKAEVPVVVLIDELDRIEDHEIRAVAQLVRSVADFPSISYVLAYDYNRVIQALGAGVSDEGRDERGRAYLEKIVQLQIPLPITFGDEINRLLVAELTSLQKELQLPDNFQNIERYQELVNIFTGGVIQTPRDIKRLVGTFHVYAGMLGQEVDWIDLLAYGALLIKAPGTISNIHRDPDMVCEDVLSMVSASAKLRRDDTALNERLSVVIPKSENNDGVQKLIGFLFPTLSGKPGRRAEYPDALCLRRPLLTTLRLGLIPGGYARKDILALVEKQPEEIERILRKSYNDDTLKLLLDRLNDIYTSLADINHVQFWKGVARFLRKPDCQWMTSYEPMHEVIQNFAGILLKAVIHDDGFKAIAAKVFVSLKNDDESVLTSAWLRPHIFMYGLFGREKRSEKGAFLNEAQTKALAQELSTALRPKHISGELIPCRWDLLPLYIMMDTGIWDDQCRQKLSEAFTDDRAVDGFTLMLYGGVFTSDKSTIEKMCAYDNYIQGVKRRLASAGIDQAHESVRVALRKAADGGW